MPGVNYQEALRIAAEGMVRVKSPVHLIKMITRYLSRELTVTHASMIVRPFGKDCYVFCDSKGSKRLPISLLKLENDNPLIRWFSLKQERIRLVRKDFLSYEMILELLQNHAGGVYDDAFRKRLLKIKQHLETYKAALCVPGFYKGELVCLLLIGKKTDASSFTNDDMLLIQTFALDVAMTLKNTEFQHQLLGKIDELEESVEEINRLRLRDKEKYLQTLITLAHMVDARDPYTYGHSEEVKKFGLLTARELGVDLEGERKHILSSALLLHDVGKLGVTDDILHKQGPLSPQEWCKMRDHAKTGARILSNHDDFKEVSVIIMHHHENFDGSGYPYKLRGEEIPIEARIIAVVDSFHAMLSDRPYRKGLTYDLAVAELKKCAGTQFDPHVVRAFLRVLTRELSMQSAEATRYIVHRPSHITL